MKSHSLVIACVVARGSAVPHSMSHPHLDARQGSIEGWAPAGENDFRGPCPMMNTLANHGYLPHDGRNLTQEAVVGALKNGINFDEQLGTIMFEQAVVANPEPNPTFFTLDMLNQHNVLEHDASLSRADAFFGNNHVFDESVFAESVRYWHSETLDANQLAMSKVARQVASKAFNPEYRFTTTTEAFSLGELAAPIIVFGDHATSTVNRTLVEYFFRNERLPAELGWTPQAEPVTLEVAAAQSKAIEDAVYLFTPDNATNTAGAAAAHRRAVLRGLHSGFLG